MRRYLVALLLESILLAVNIQTGESIECYVCNSNIDKKCGNPIDTTDLHKMECTLSGLEKASAEFKKTFQNFANLMGFDGIPQGPHLDTKFACQKIDIVSTDQSGSSSVTIMRSCTLAKSESIDPCAMTDRIESMSAGKGKVAFCDTCEDDLCNGSSHQSFTTFFVFVVPCFVIILSSWISV